MAAQVWKPALRASLWAAEDEPGTVETQVFKMLDVNGDGILSLKDMEPLLTIPERFNAIAARMGRCRSHEGFSLREFAAAFKNDKSMLDFYHEQDLAAHPAVDAGHPHCSSSTTSQRQRPTQRLTRQESEKKRGRSQEATQKQVSSTPTPTRQRSCNSARTPRDRKGVATPRTSSTTKASWSCLDNSDVKPQYTEADYPSLTPRSAAASADQTPAKGQHGDSQATPKPSSGATSASLEKSQKSKRVAPAGVALTPGGSKAAHSARGQSKDAKEEPARRWRAKDSTPASSEIAESEAPAPRRLSVHFRDEDRGSSDDDQKSGSAEESKALAEALAEIQRLRSELAAAKGDATSSSKASPSRGRAHTKNAPNEDRDESAAVRSKSEAPAQVSQEQSTQRVERARRKSEPSRFYNDTEAPEPRPPNSDCWDWPLSRHEKKERVLYLTNLMAWHAERGGAC